MIYVYSKFKIVPFLNNFKNQNLQYHNITYKSVNLKLSVSPFQLFHIIEILKFSKHIIYKSLTKRLVKTMKALSLLICVVSLPSLTTSTNRTLRFSSQPQFTLHKWRKLKPKRCSSSKNSLRKWQAKDLMTKDQDHKTELLLLLLRVSTKMMVQTPQMDQKLPALLPSSSFSLPSNSLRIR